MRSYRNLVIVLPLTFVLGYLLVFAAIHHLTDGFALSKISSTLPYSKERETPSRVNVEKILDQPFYYLEKGSQCYAFESEDGRYVLKFFRQSRYRLPWFAKHLSLPTFLSKLQNQHLQRKEKKLNDLFTSCQIAYQELYEESGLIFLHLNKTSSLNQPVVLYDNLKRPRSIDIDRYEFLIQHKGSLIYPYLSQIIAQGKRNQVKKTLQGLITTLEERFQKGIDDKDAVLHKNMGFRNGKVQYLDVGQFSMNPKIKNPAIYRQKIKKIVQPLTLWLKERDYELALQFESILNESFREEN